jgi:predicted secreted protein
MGMELRHDWNSGVPLAPGSVTPGTVEPSAPAKTNRTAKMLIVTAAAAATLMWTAFLCYLIAALVRSLL